MFSRTIKRFRDFEGFGVVKVFNSLPTIREDVRKWTEIEKIKAERPKDWEEKLLVSTVQTG